MKATRKDSVRNSTPLRAVLLIAALLMAGHANAQWQVTDEVTHEGLDRVDSTLKNETNKRLEEIRNQQKINQAKKSADKDPDDPEVTFEPTTPIVAGYGEETRCPAPPASAKAAQDQWTICKEIVKTELAQYKYALAMRKVAIERQGRLKAIEDARGNLKEDDTGKLQSNSNELLALIARMETDRQQYRTYMDAYAARLSYLRSMHESIGQKVINGSSKGGLVDVVTGGVALGTLELALDAQRTKNNGGRFK